MVVYDLTDDLQTRLSYRTPALILVVVSLVYCLGTNDRPTRTGRERLIMTPRRPPVLAGGILILVVGASFGLTEALPGVDSSMTPKEAKQRLIALQDRGAGPGPLWYTD